MVGKNRYNFFNQETRITVKQEGFPTHDPRFASIHTTHFSHPWPQKLIKVKIGHSWFFSHVGVAKVTSSLHTNLWLLCWMSVRYGHM